MSVDVGLAPARGRTFGFVEDVAPEWAAAALPVLRVAAVGLLSAPDPVADAESGAAAWRGSPGALAVYGLLLEERSSVAERWFTGAQFLLVRTGNRPYSYPVDAGLGDLGSLAPVEDAVDAGDSPEAAPAPTPSRDLPVPTTARVAPPTDLYCTCPLTYWLASAPELPHAPAWYECVRCHLPSSGYVEATAAGARHEFHGGDLDGRSYSTTDLFSPVMAGRGKSRASTGPAPEEVRRYAVTSSSVSEEEDGDLFADAVAGEEPGARTVTYSWTALA